VADTIYDYLTERFMLARMLSLPVRVYTDPRHWGAQVLQAKLADNELVVTFTDTQLTDPGTGRTVMYIRSSDTKIPTMLNQFVGVKGDITTDEKLTVKVVTPTEISTVDQSQLFKTIAAEVIPPSLSPKTQSASTGN